MEQKGGVNIGKIFHHLGFFPNNIIRFHPQNIKMKPKEGKIITNEPKRFNLPNELKRPVGQHALKYFALHPNGQNKK